jgi:hypothetical protein
MYPWAGFVTILVRGNASPVKRNADAFRIGERGRGTLTQLLLCASGRALNLIAGVAPDMVSTRSNMQPHPIPPLALAIGVLSTLCIFPGFLCAMLVPRYVDPEKIRKEPDKKIVGMMSNPWLPRRVLTPTGVKIWLARNYLLGTGLLLAFVSIALQ